MCASHLGADLLLPPPSPLQLMGGQGQGHRPQGCGKKDLPQAWCQPQLGEGRLQEKRQAAGLHLPGRALRGAELCWGAPKGHRRPQALRGYLLTRNDGEPPPPRRDLASTSEMWTAET